jgi:hypothetical protein
VCARQHRKKAGICSEYVPCCNIKESGNDRGDEALSLHRVDGSPLLFLSLGFLGFLRGFSLPLPANQLRDVVMAR